VFVDREREALEVLDLDNPRGISAAAS